MSARLRESGTQIVNRDKRLRMPNISAFTRVFDALCAGMSRKGASTSSICSKPLRRHDQIGEFLARIEHARLHRGFADANDIGNLLDGLAVVIDEIDDLAMFRR